MVELNVYKVIYKRYSDYYHIHVVAPTPEGAIEDAGRWYRAKHYSDIEITEVSREVEAAIYYKTPKRRR